ncbi:hypothetical protein POSPLADRAFT_1139630, partial [Postia placenta MAD-698-R-SB12]
VANASALHIQSRVKREPHAYVKLRVNNERKYKTAVVVSNSPIWNTDFEINGVQESTALSFELYDNGFLPKATRQSLGLAETTVGHLLMSHAAPGGAKLKMGGKYLRPTIMISIKEVDFVEAIGLDLAQKRHDAEEAVLSPKSVSEQTVSQKLKILADALGKICPIMDAVADIHPYVRTAVKIVTSLCAVIQSQFDRDEAVLSLVEEMTTLFTFVTPLQSLKAEFSILAPLAEVIKTIVLQTVECLIFLDGYNQSRFMEVLDSLIGGTGHCSLDDLYDKALHSSLDRHWLKPDFAQAFNDVLGLVLAAKLPISAIAIDQFLGGRRRARGVLSPMRHLLQYSHVDEDEPVQLLHTSFRDFISNTSRSDMPWFVDVERHNYRFALRCMGILHPHPCLPAQHRGEPSLGLTMLKVEAKEYACTQWILHVCDMVTCPAGFERTLQQWLETYMIAWLEDMSELGKSGNILDLLEQLLRWVKAVLPMNASLHDLVYDGGRFSAFYSSSISEGSVSIWAALSFAPKRNRLFTLFHRPELPTVVGGYLQQWSPALRLFQKDVTVHSLAFSPDGTKIVSSGVVKGTRDVGYALIPDEKFVLRIWDVKTGTEAIPAPLLDGPSIVAFAPDTTEVWAASANGTIYKVDATTGNLNLEHQISNRTKPFPQSDDTAGHLIDVGIAPSGSDLDDQGAEANPRSDAADFNLFAHGMLVPPASNLPTIDSTTFGRENFATAAFSPNGLWVVLDEQTYGRFWILSLEALKSPYAPLTPPTSQSWPIRRETYGHTPHSLDFSPDSSIFS